MNKIPNSQGITKIVMYPTAITKCEIGQDWYQNDLEIVFIPNDYYPDYIEVQNWIMENIDGKEMNIEDVIYSIKNYLLREYNPRNVKIISHITNNKVHFRVDVEG